MKRKTLLWAFVCSILLLGGAWAQDQVSVLFVVADAGALNEGDQAVLDRFESVFGFTVELTNHNDVDSTWADGMNFAYVSSTTTSSTIAGKLKNIPIPLFMNEAYALDENGMSRDNDSTRFASEFSRDLVITAEDHYLAAELTGEVAIFNDYEMMGMQGLPNENGTLIAQWVEWDVGELPCLGAMFCYEKGALMADSTLAAERRLFFGLHDLGTARFTENGQKMWDNAINWCLYKDQESAIANETDQLPAGYKLAQNYPNPFNPSTTISFTIPKASQVVLSVYDLRGRRVAELVNGYKNAGSYSTNFDAPGLASGLYVYRLQTEDFAHSKKMLLMR